jgi:L-asparagine transporter-like permease
MNIKQQIIRTTVAWAVLITVLLTLNPDKMPVVLLIAPFVVLYVATYQLALLARTLLRRLRGKEEAKTGTYKRFGSVCAGLVVALGLLSSLGQLTARDVSTLLLIVAIGYFYLVRYAKTA